MKPTIHLGLVLSLSLTGLGCTSILGDVTFDRNEGGQSASSTTTESGGGGGMTTTSASTTSGSAGSGGATTSTSLATCASLTCTLPATCLDAPTGATCQCPSGYHDVKGDGSQCDDWDECKGENGGDNCAGIATCKNTPGGFTCECPAGGYEYPPGSGACVDDPCQPSLCPPSNVCTNDTGVAVCTCVVFVDGAATGAGTGASWADALATPQAALDKADALVKGGEASCDVWVKEGTYFTYDPAAPKSGLRLKSNVGVYGGFQGTELRRADADPKAHPTILSAKSSAGGAERANHVVSGFDVANAAIDGFTIRDGAALAGPSPEDQRGGGVVLYVFNAPQAIGASLAISRCEITGNAAQTAGGVGMQLFNGKPLSISITDSSIHGNTAVYGGGGVACSGDGCTLTRTDVRANVAAFGGGLQSDVKVTADTVTFAENIATSGDGGGLLLVNGSQASVLSRVVVRGNHAEGRGGGLAATLPSGGVTITNGVFVGNSAPEGGAVLDDSASGFSCASCTITGNRGTTKGDGVRFLNGGPTFLDSILWGNPNLASASLGKDVDPPTWASVNAATSDIHGYAGPSATVIDANPSFATLPVFFDRVATTTAAVASVAVPSGAIYTAGDVIEIGGDGVARAVSLVNGNVVTFSPALAAAAPAGTSILDWGSAFAKLDLHVLGGSPCVDTASGAPATDVEGKPRIGTADMGAYESH